MTVIPPHPDAEFDALIMGRAGMDLYPLPDGTKTEDAAEFASDLGGSAGNIAVAAARHGVRIGLAAPVSDDPVGRFVAKTLARFGVVHVTPEPVTGDPRTSLALAETLAEGSETVIYRNNAADFQMPPVDAARARAVVVTGTALAQEPSRSVCLTALEEAPYSILDLDYRPYSWAEGEAAETYRTASAKADMIVGNAEEFAILGGRDAADALAASGKTILYKKGAEGCEVLGKDPLIVPPYPVRALKPFGAGDAYLGGVLAKLLQGAALADALRFGSAAAAIVVSRRGCASAMPDTETVDAFLKERA